MFRTKGMVAFTLYPDRAYLELSVQLYNRTPFPQTFLWWANPAVRVNDDYQSVFPPDVNAVMDHGKRDVSSFPIATGAYYNMIIRQAPTSPCTRTSPCRHLTWLIAPTMTSSDLTIMGGARA